MGGTDLKPADGVLRGSAHHFPLRIYFEDTDVAGIVYYANYLRYMERARSDLLAQIGVDQRATLEAGVGVYAVADVSIRYKAPARLADDLVVVTEVQAVRAASVLIHQQVMRGEEVLTDATVTAAFLTPEGRPRRQPREWLEKFERFQGKDKSGE
jgi:acyl-CoA thioester hydrolase